MILATGAKKKRQKCPKLVSEAKKVSVDIKSNASGGDALRS
jgi:hypothetical protein